MKKLICILISLAVILSGFPLYSFAEAETSLYSDSFEGAGCMDSWYKYYPDYYEDGKFGYSLNTNSSYITDGKQSLYVIDKDSERYFAVASPIFAVNDFGEYTLTVDVRVLSGSIKFYIRCYESDRETYTQKLFTVPVNDEMTSCSFSRIITPDTPYVRVLVLTDTVGANEAGYVDNLIFTKTGEYDEAQYLAKKSVTVQLKEAIPGDVIEIPDGTYTDWVISVDKDGTKDKPITLKAKNPGKVIFTGGSGIVVSGDYVNIEGLRFEEVISSQIIRFDSTSYGSKLRDTVIYNCHPDAEADTVQQNWVMLRGTALTVENCFFYGKHSKGQMVESSKSEETKDIFDEHIIKNCYFGNIKQQSENGYEAIRLGTSAYSFDTAKTVVEGCFFEKCDGESEIISVKSCGITVRNNTLYNSNGAIVLRHGNGSDIYGNLFVGGPGKKRLSGVRIIGEDHKVHDNYFYNMTEKSQVLVFYNGNPYEGIEDYWYYPVKNAQVYNNTFIGGDYLVSVGGYTPGDEGTSYNRVMAPEGYFNNNVLVTFQGLNPMIVNGDPAPDLNVDDDFAYNKVSFSGNIAYGKSVGYNPGGLTEGYFDLTEDGKYFKAPSGKGANSDEVKKAPTSPFDIISSWVKEVYYDAGIIEFTPVANDVFNDEDAHINNIVPFEVTCSAGAGGTVTLKENGNAVSGKTSFSNNPVLTVIAKPDADKVLSGWYVNGVELTEGNCEALGIVADSPLSDTLTISNLVKNYDIRAEFEDLYIIPDEILSPVAEFGENNGSVTVKNHNGITTTVSGAYRIFAVRLSMYDYATVSECGFKVISDNGEITVKSKTKLSDSGAYGVLFYGFTKGKTYTVYPYAIYTLENGTQKTVAGEAKTVVVE